MKRQPIIVAVALLLVVGAALWGVNYRLDHPPMTKADKEFRALVAGADSLQVSQASCQDSACIKKRIIKYNPFNAAQTRELIEQLQFLDVSPSEENSLEVLGNSQKCVVLRLDFSDSDGISTHMALFQTSKLGKIVGGPQDKTYYLNPRFNKRLNRVLDAYLPQRVRP